MKVVCHLFVILTTCFESNIKTSHAFVIQQRTTASRTSFLIERRPNIKNNEGTKTRIQLQNSNNEENEDDSEEEIDLSDRDWRSFRAQLVMNSSEKKDDNEDDLDGIGSLFEKTPMKTENFTPLNPSQWAYDSGNVIEQGAVILGGVEQDYGFGLRQQYFHKSVILVLDHSSQFTKGIILNRPSDLMLVDDEDSQKNGEYGLVVMCKD